MRVAAGSALSLLDLPENPLRDTAAGRFTAAVLDSFEHLTRRFGKPRFGFNETTVDGKSVRGCRGKPSSTCHGAR